MALWQRLPPEVELDFSAFCRHKQSLVWSSGCSGSESPRLAFEGIEHLGNLKYSKFPATSHKISAEWDDVKRGFIDQTTQNVEQLLKDVYHITCKRAWCYKQNCYVSPDCDCDTQVWVIGFSCKSVSGYNKHKHQHKNAHMDWSTQTGYTLHAVYLILEYKRPRFVILENVENILQILEEILDACRARGYFCAPSLQW